MRRSVGAVIIGVILSLSAACQHRGAAEPATAVEYVNGYWFDGRGFTSRTYYAADGELRSSRPEGRTIRTVDLGGGFVVPPFGEAHNHNIEQSERLQRTVCSYLADGVFYVRNPNSLPRLVPQLMGSGLESSFAHGGLTGPGGHPIGVVERNIGRGAWTIDDGEGAFYFVVDGPRDLAAKWPALLATGTDFVKVYLLYSEEHALRKGNEAYKYWRGLDPVLLPEIVRRSRSAGLDVIAHVETAADFRAAVSAGVDEIAHLPGSRPDRDEFANYGDGSRYRISDADAALAAAHEIKVTTTVGELLALVAEPGFDPAQAQTIRMLHRDNLRTLKRHGVTILLGSDSYGDTSRGEFEQLSRLGVFTPAELLAIWSSTTPAAIFPDRKIGRLTPSSEASFLVLGANPLRDPAAIADIRMRVKLGRPAGCGAP